jgi:putative protease
MKTALYAAVTARTYRQAIDDYLADPELYKRNLPHYVEEIGRCTSRKFTEGFYFGRPDETSMIYDSNTYEVGAVYYGTVGAVTEKDGIPRAVIEQKNKFLTGSTMEIMKPDGRNILTRVREIADEEGTVMESAPHLGQRLFLAMDPMPEEGDILRSAKEEDE